MRKDIRKKNSRYTNKVEWKERKRGVKRQEILNRRRENEWREQQREWV